jgi:hypothetical protein
LVTGGYEHAVLNLRASLGVAVQFGDDDPSALLQRLLRAHEKKRRQDGPRRGGSVKRY